MIKNIMTKNIIVGKKDDNIQAIADIMLKYDIGFLPIADGNKIIGVITDRDIVVRCLANNEETTSVINKYTTDNIFTIDVDEEVEEALYLMGEEKIKRLLVKDENKIVGILSLSDIVNNFDNQQLIIKTIQKIWEIDKNVDELIPKVNEFIL